MASIERVDFRVSGEMMIIQTTLSRMIATP